MKILETANPSTEQKENIYTLWNREYPAQLCFQGIGALDNYLSTLAGLRYYFLANDSNKLQAWAFTFTREEERWFAITVDNNLWGRGKGTLLLSRLKENEKNLNGWVIDHNNDIKHNGEKYTSPLNFYLKNGFTLVPESRLEIPVLSAVKITWERKK